MSVFQQAAVATLINALGEDRLHYLYPRQNAAVYIASNLPEAEQEAARRLAKDTYGCQPLEETEGWRILAERGALDDETSRLLLKKVASVIYLQGAKGNVRLFCKERSEDPRSYLRETLTPSCFAGRHDILINNMATEQALARMGWNEHLSSASLDGMRIKTRPPKAEQRDDYLALLFFGNKIAQDMLARKLAGNMGLLAPPEDGATFISSNYPLLFRDKFMREHPEAYTIQQTPGWKTLSRAGLFDKNLQFTKADKWRSKALVCAACYQFVRQVRGNLNLLADPANEPENGLMRVMIIPLLKARMAAGDALTINGKSVADYLQETSWDVEASPSGKLNALTARKKKPVPSGHSPKP